MGLGFIAYESLAPYTLGDKIYIFYYSSNGLATNGLFYATYDADFIPTKYRKYAADQPLKNPDFSNNQVLAIDCESVVAGPDGASMPYLFWNSINEKLGKSILTLANSNLITVIPAMVTNPALQLQKVLHDKT
ncbi:hypothetical protein [Pandoraea horticolens]|uniref:hypothetical protein n=1 Tax=Pandoraea horticolens TaxID=2508298 RepID=UPI00123FF43A|nr:hypothetical protein [Pandoraea horticolens]